MKSIIIIIIIMIMIMIMIMIIISSIGNHRVSSSIWN